jgi:uncharacterized protein (TIGR02118 family)
MTGTTSGERDTSESVRHEARPFCGRRNDRVPQDGEPVIKFVVSYRVPADVDAFDAAYFGTHVPIVKQTPGLVRTELAKVLKTVAGEPSLHVIAELFFESYDDLKAAFKSEQWAASGANLAEWGATDLVASMHIAEVVNEAGN